MIKKFLLLLLTTVAALGQQSGLSDLSLVWVRNFNLTGVSALALDNNGNSYVLGPAQPGFTPTNAPYGTQASLGSIAIVKLDPLGAVVWSTVLYGGTGSALAIDSAQNVYLAGWADGTAFPTTRGAFQTRLSKDVAFAAKLSGSGLLEWATLLGGQDEVSLASAIAVNATGVYVAGQTQGHSFPTTPGAFQETAKPAGPSLPSAWDGFIAKLNPAGSALIFSTLLGGSDYDGIAKIAIDNNGAIYALGRSASPDFPVTPSAYQSTGYLFLTKMNPTGSGLLYSTFLAVSGGNVTGLGVDLAGNGYVATPDRVLKVNATGTQLVYDLALTGNRGFAFWDMVIDPSGDAFVVGSTFSSDLPIPATCFPLLAGVPVASKEFILRLNSAGKIVDGGYFPLAPDFYPEFTVLRKDSSGNIYAADVEGGGSAESALPNAIVRKFAPGSVTPGPVRLRCVANGAHLGKSAVAPGEIVGLFGDRIGPDQAANLQFDSSGRVASVLGNTRVFFDGIPSPLLYAQSQQINAVAPWGIQGRMTTEICVVYLGEKTNCIKAPVSEVSPGFFRIPSGTIAALNEDSTVNTTDNPAKPGSIVTLFVTGTGPSIPPQSDGEVTQGVQPGAVAVEVDFLRNNGRLGGISLEEVPIEVVFHGPAPALVAGVEVIQVRVPLGLAFSVQLSIRSSMGGSLADTAAIRLVSQ